MDTEFDLLNTLIEIKQELKEGKTDRANSFIDLVISNGDVLVDLENQLSEEL